MVRRPQISTRTDTLDPHKSLFRSGEQSVRSPSCGAQHMLGDMGKPQVRDVYGLRDFAQRGVVLVMVGDLPGDIDAARGNEAEPALRQWLGKPAPGRRRIAAIPLIGLIAEPAVALLRDSAVLDMPWISLHLILRYVRLRWRQTLPADPVPIPQARAVRPEPITGRTCGGEG